MAVLITSGMRKAIKKMVQVSNCARVLNLLPTAEDFALRLIGDMKIITNRVNSISTRINNILDRYSSIPGEFLLEGFDEILEKLDNVSDYTKFAIKETSDVMSSTVKSTREMTEALGSATSGITSATLQIGGGLTYGAVALSSNLNLAMTGNGEVTNDTAEHIRDWTVTTATNTVESIDDFFGKAGDGLNNAVEWIDNQTNKVDDFVDGVSDELMEKVENAKNKVEEKIQRVKETFDKFIKDYDDAFGFLNGNAFKKASDAAYEMDTPVYDAFGDMTGEIANFIKNFNIGKVIKALGGIVVGAGSATLAMDLLPSIDTEKMLRSIIGGVDSYNIDKIHQLHHNKYYETEPDLLDVPDVPWLLSKDDLEKYNADGYNKYLEEYGEENDKRRTEILEKMQKATTRAELREVKNENKEKMKENKSALKAMRKVRRDAIKAKQIEKYKGFLSIELRYLKRDCLNMKTTIKNEWDTMLNQYTLAIKEIKKFFTNEGDGGSETVDRCCDRINDDATQIVELCKSIGVELTNAVAMVPTPYAIGSCFDMPVHKILAFFKDIKIIITFIKNLIRLGIDIISQLTIIVKLCYEGLQNLSDILKTLKETIGVDKILKMIDYLLELFGPKMEESKILMENSITPILYNETEDYERRIDAIDEDDSETLYMEEFKYSDDPNARKKIAEKVFGGKNAEDEDEFEEWVEELEAKGEREIVAYRSPLLNEEGDDFAGWIYYHAYAYDKMSSGWSKRKKRRKNKVIKKASKKNKLIGKKLVGGVAKLKSDNKISNSMSSYDAYYWYTEWTNDPTDCDPDFNNVECVYDEDGNLIPNENFKKNVVSPVNGSLVELYDGRMVFVEGEVVKSGDFVRVDGIKYKVK